MSFTAVKLSKIGIFSCQSTKNIIRTIRHYYLLLLILQLTTHQKVKRQTGSALRALSKKVSIAPLSIMAAAAVEERRTSWCWDFFCGRLLLSSLKMSRRGGESDQKFPIVSKTPNWAPSSQFGISPN